MRNGDTVVSMSHKTQAFCKASIANRTNFHNNTRLVGNDIHNQPRDYEREYSFSGQMTRVYDDHWHYKVYSYDRCIGYYCCDRSWWVIDPESHDISQTTKHHFNLMMQVIHDTYCEGEYDLVAFNDSTTMNAID